MIRKSTFGGSITWATLWILSLSLISSAQSSLADNNYVSVQVPGTNFTQPMGINNLRQIVGFYHDASGQTQSFLLSGGKYTTLVLPGLTAPTATGINDHAEIVGTYGSFIVHGFDYKNGTVRPIDYPGSTQTFVTCINNLGEIGGGYLDTNGALHGFVLQAGTYNNLDHPSSILTEVLGINDSGVVAGYYYDLASKQHGFVYAAGIFTDVDAPGGTFTQITDINNESQIVGYYLNGGLDTGLERLSSTFQTLSFPGSNGTFLHGLNDQMQIVGDYRDIRENQFGFLITAGTRDAQDVK